MKKNKIAYGFLLGIALLLTNAGNLFPQWNGNPYKNLLVCDLENEQIQPKIASAPDGGCYISWFDKRNGMYAVYLQKLDRNGIRQWGENGLLISNKSQDTWLTDNCLISDRDGNALLAFADKRAGQSLGVSVYKITPQGGFAWGKDGIYLSEKRDYEYFEHSPKLVQASDGNYFAVWETIVENDINKILVQKLSPDGNKMFPNGNVWINGTLAGSIYARVVPSDDGSALIAFMQYSESELVKNDNMELTVQKVSKNGYVMFPLNNDLKSGIRINNTPGIIYFIRPFLVPDNNNGAYVGWQDLRDGGLNYGSYIQHIKQDGGTTFRENGVSGVDTYGNSQLYPKIAVNKSTSEAVLFWIDNESGEKGVNRLMCQKYDATGGRTWQSGKQVFSLPASAAIPDYEAVSGSTGIFVLIMYSDNCGSDCTIECRKITWEGEQAWSGPVIMGGMTGKTSLEAAIGNNDMCIAAWSDKRLDNGGIYAQNIYSNGKMGDETNDIADYGVAVEGFGCSPNPFISSFNFKYSIKTNEIVNISICNMLGEKIRDVFNGHQTAGDYDFNINGAGLSPGSYYIIVTYGENKTIGKVMKCE